MPPRTSGRPLRRRTTGPQTRVLVDASLLALAAAAAIAVAASLQALQPVLVLAAACLVPGGALLTRLRVDNTITAAGLAIALSLAVDTAASLALVWSQWWHPEVLALVVGGASATLLAQDLRLALHVAPDATPEGEA